MLEVLPPGVKDGQEGGVRREGMTMSIATAIAPARRSPRPATTAAPAWAPADIRAIRQAVREYERAVAAARKLQERADRCIAIGLQPYTADFTAAASDDAHAAAGERYCELGRMVRAAGAMAVVTAAHLYAFDDRDELPGGAIPRARIIDIDAAGPARSA
jgi:hypothetical protein